LQFNARAADLVGAAMNGQIHLRLSD